MKKKTITPFKLKPATDGKPPVSGSASDFERELYKLINAYVSAGLKKPDLVHKMEYVTQSCRVS
jgi:hypothetical protein